MVKRMDNIIQMLFIIPKKEKFHGQKKIYLTQNQ